MTTTKSNRRDAWVDRLITGLFTAAAAWGSVAVQIDRTVNARAERAEIEIAATVGHRLDASLATFTTAQDRVLDTMRTDLAELASHVASLAGRPLKLTAPPPVVVSKPDTATAQGIDAINERLRYVAIAIARINSQIADMAKQQAQPLRQGNSSPYGR